MAVSGNGKINASWTHLKEPLFFDNGGHGMVFEEEGKRLFVMHYPNERGKEKPVFFELKEKDGRLILDTDGNEEF